MKVKFMFLLIIVILSFLSILKLNTLLTKFLHSNEKSTYNQDENSTIVTTPFELKDSLINLVDNEFLARKNRINYLCNTMDKSKYKNDSVFKKAVLNIVIDTKHNLTWCPIYKAASSMWMKNFAVLSGFSINESLAYKTHLDYGSIVKQKFQQTDNSEEKLKQISSTTKFMVVRHPFERLLSAYRDKLEHMQSRDYYYRRYGKYIRNKYRAKHSNLTSLEPSFEEFLQFIAKEKIFDEHWIPFYDSCQPCSIEYDYILKFESLKDDFNVFISKNNLDSYIDYVKSDRKSTSSQGITNELIAKRYFKNISESLLFSIFKIYELDFLLFSYSPAKYYYMTSN